MREWTKIKENHTRQNHIKQNHAKQDNIMPDNAMSGSEGRQKALRLMEALSQVDEALLARSEDAGEIPFWRYGRILAACFVFAVLGACALGVYGMVMWKGAGALDDGMNGAGALQLEAYAYDTAAAEARPGAGNGEESLGFQNAQNNGSCDQSGGMGDSAGWNNGMGDGGFQDGGMSGGSSQGGMSDSTGLERGAGESAVQGQTSAQSGQAFAGSSNSSAGKQPDSLEQPVQKQMEGASADGQPDMEACTVPANPRRELTLEEAKAKDTIGSYVPSVLPAGYRLESASESTEVKSDKDLMLTWCRGMDFITLYITDYYAIAKPPQGVAELAVADLSRPETYDVRLYEIPYCDSVPSEYQEIFDHPVFNASDLSLAVVEARMKSVADRGDTDTPRGNFSVLYGSGVLVRFSGRGTAEEIWEMFQSVNP